MNLIHMKYYNNKATSKASFVNELTWFLYQLKMSWYKNKFDNNTSLITITGQGILIVLDNFLFVHKVKQCGILKQISVFWK